MEHNELKGLDLSPEKAKHLQSIVPHVQPIRQVRKRVLVPESVAVPWGRGLTGRERVERCPMRETPGLAFEYDESQGTVLSLEIFETAMLAHDRQYVIADRQRIRVAGCRNMQRHLRLSSREELALFERYAFGGPRR